MCQLSCATEVWCYSDHQLIFVLYFLFLHAARIGKMKRRKQDEGQVCPLCNRPLAGSEQEMSRHVEHCLSKVEGLWPPTSLPLPFPGTCC